MTEIRKNEPIPAKRRGKVSAHPEVMQLEPGDCLVTDLDAEDSVRGAARVIRLSHGRKFTGRRMNGEFKLWRIE